MSITWPSQFYNIIGPIDESVKRANALFRSRNVYPYSSVTARLLEMRLVSWTRPSKLSATASSTKHNIDTNNGRINKTAKQRHLATIYGRFGTFSTVTVCSCLLVRGTSLAALYCRSVAEWKYVNCNVTRALTNLMYLQQTKLPPEVFHPYPIPIGFYQVCVMWVHGLIVIHTWLTQSCQVEVVQFLESFPWSPEADAIRWGGGSSRIFQESPKADAIRWGGGGSSNFPWSPLPRSQLLPHIRWYSWVETHISDKYGKSQDLLRKNNLSLKFPQFREFSLQFRETWRSRAISGDSRKFRETWQVCWHYL